MKDDISYTKEDFVAILSVATPQEINMIIEDRGKEPPRIPLVIFFSK